MNTPRRTLLICAISGACFIGLLWNMEAQQPDSAKQKQAKYVPEDHRPPLFFKEDFRHTHPDIPEEPVTQEAIITPGLELKLYGQTKQGKNPDTGIYLIHRVSPKDDPVFVYTGPCMTPCALAFRHKDNFVDLSGMGKIHWRNRTHGFHVIRPIVKLAVGTWLVGDVGNGQTVDWHEEQISLADVRWHYLNVDYVVTTKTDAWVLNPDLTRVDEIGFTDLMPGNAADRGHGYAGSTSLDWMEVWGTPVPRTASSPTK